MAGAGGVAGGLRRWRQARRRRLQGLRDVAARRHPPVTGGRFIGMMCRAVGTARGVRHSWAARRHRATATLRSTNTAVPLQASPRHFVKSLQDVVKLRIQLGE